MNTGRLVKSLLLVVAFLASAAASAITVTPSEISQTLSIMPNGPAASFSGVIGFREGGTDDMLLKIGGSGGLTTATDLTFSFLNGSESLGFYKSGTAINQWDLITQATASGGLLHSSSMTISALLAAGTYLLHITGPVLSTYSGSVSAVPLPAAVWLFGSALLGFVTMSNRRKV